jgi:hypothetical protein
MQTRGGIKHKESEGFLDSTVKPDGMDNDISTPKMEVEEVSLRQEESNIVNLEVKQSKDGSKESEVMESKESRVRESKEV